MVDENQDPTTTNPDLEKSFEKSGAGKRKKAVVQPSYKVIGNTKIPVSKSAGKLWQSRKGQAKRACDRFNEAWEEAVRYYNHDQMNNRDGSGPETSGTKWAAGKLHEGFVETENIVFANVSTMVPILYAKNPVVEFTANNKQNKQMATVYERLINILFNMKATPGVNLKPKGRRAVLLTLLTNMSWIEIGYTTKEDSSEQALIDINGLSDELEKAKDSKAIREIEGKLMAVDKTIDILQPEGPFTKVLRSDQLLIDPTATEDDLSDANWVMRPDFLPTEFVRAKYMTKTKGSDEHALIYAPTHVIPAAIESNKGVDDETDFKLFESDGMERLGYTDEDAYRRAQMTKVWMVWDKVTRRVLMFHNDDWTWPIWVWNDPYQLINFYPFYGLTFAPKTHGMYSKGEVTYYVDQQDAINEINAEERTARWWAKRNLIFNLNTISRDDVEALLKGVDGTARGIDVPEGQKLSDALDSVPPPGITNWPDLFNKQSKFDAIDRISSIRLALRGVEFKTNTTNEAIDTYNEATSIRVDDKIDAIEDLLGDVGFGLLQLCAKFMDKTLVVSLIGPELGNLWNAPEQEQLRSEFSMRIVGGSTEKPTSNTKKREALEIGQILGQFASAHPIVVLKMLEVFQQAFDEVTIKDEDWEQIKAALFGQGTGEEQPTSGNGSGDEEQIRAAIDQLPPEAKEAVAQLIQSGAAPTEALRQVQQRLQA